MQLHWKHWVLEQMDIIQRFLIQIALHLPREMYVSPLFSLAFLDMARKMRWPRCFRHLWFPSVSSGEEGRQPRGLRCGFPKEVHFAEFPSTV